MGKEENRREREEEAAVEQTEKGSEQGRPSKFNEPTVKKQFTMPVSLNDQLLSVTAFSTKNPQGVPNGPEQADFIREAVEAKLKGEKTLTIDEVIQRTVTKMLEEDGVRVNIDKRDRTKLEKAAEKIGFEDVADLMKSFVRRALSSPEEVDAFLKAPAKERIAARGRANQTDALEGAA